MQMNEWIEWNGAPSEKPVIPGWELVQVQLGSGEILTREMNHWYWWVPRELPSAIQRYRIYRG